jgi:hypothetical protein
MLLNSVPEQLFALAAEVQAPLVSAPSLNPTLQSLSLLRVLPHILLFYRQLIVDCVSKLRMVS